MAKSGTPSVQLTDYHAKYLSYELTRRAAAGTAEGLANVLADARVDLNPHQVDAANFALQNPFSKGVILADETGLGKTIEAGLLIAQRWAERKRKILIILPANLRKQWSQELAEKFSISTRILESKTFNQEINRGNFNPFDAEQVVVCSYQFARSKESYLRHIKWDLIVIDEAHRLRNVYRGNSKIANSIKQTVAPFQKVLLTATPLQNSLNELYGLVSIIDDYHFGDLESFRLQYGKRLDPPLLKELKDRLALICKRTLRKQVLQYIKYTNRHALVQEFVPSDVERKLYTDVTEFLQRENLHSLPTGQRQLITMVLQKLLASSSFAIAGTLEGMVTRLEEAIVKAERAAGVDEVLAQDFEEIDELADEWEEEAEEEKEEAQLSPKQIKEFKSEVAEIRSFAQLARSIAVNAKGETLLLALRKGFAAAEDAQKAEGAERLQQKAIIFTESRRTQEYVLELINASEFKGKAVLFNGTNNDAKSKEIYAAWMARHQGTDQISGSPTADMRAALVDYFRNEASILIATEAASEGINLQFCNLIVNYDLPWNPQRIEQRIGRCHRYGQKYDVVVVNFINKENKADQRVYELLREKFLLFDGVFGASDEVLGAIESGVDFERKIATIYRQCRTPEQITFEFDKLQDALSTEIEVKERSAREMLLNNFDQEVVERVRIESLQILDTFNERLWSLTKHLLRDVAEFDDTGYSFRLRTNPFTDEQINEGPYRMARGATEENMYRIGHPLAKRILDQGQTIATPVAELVVDYSSSGKKISVVEQLVGQSGWVMCSLASVDGAEQEDRLIFVGQAEDGTEWQPDQVRRIFDVSASIGTKPTLERETKVALEEKARHLGVLLGQEIDVKIAHWHDAESDRLERWAEDKRRALAAALEEAEQKYQESRKAARSAGSLKEKLEQEKVSAQLDRKRDDAWKRFDEEKIEIRSAKERLQSELSNRAEQSLSIQELFVVKVTIK